MKLKNSFLNRHSLPIGIFLMFLLTWPIDLAKAGILPIPMPFAIYILLGYGFVLASIFMTGLTLGKRCVTRLMKRFLIWRVGWKWYLAAFLLVPTIDILAIYLNAAWRQAPIDFSTAYGFKIFGPSANLMLLAIPFFLFDVFTNGEEIGWRGYVLPRLQSKYNALTSSLVLGFIWSLWHIPKFLPHWNTISFAWFSIDTIAKAVLLTWIYNNTRGSLLLATLFHASSNTAGVLLPMATTAAGNYAGANICVALITVLIALWVTIIAGPERLSMTNSKEVEEAHRVFSLGPQL